MENLRTTDLYLVAYLLSNSIQPTKIVSEGLNDRKKIIFLFNGNTDVVRHFAAFNRGEAMANVSRFRHDYETARDWMFANLRATSRQHVA